MRDSLLLLMDKDRELQQHFLVEPISFHCVKAHFISRLISFVDDSIQKSRSFRIPDLAGGLLLWASNYSALKHTSINVNLTPSFDVSESCSLILSIPSDSLFCSGRMGSSPPHIWDKVSKLLLRLLPRNSKSLHSFSALSVATEVAPQSDNIAVALPPCNTSRELRSWKDEWHCGAERAGCECCPFPGLEKTTKAVEPKTGIEFPMILDTLSCQRKASLAHEVLVGTGFRSMKIIRIKTLKVYAFGFYVHPYSVCKKLASKYGSFTVDELNNRRDFYHDLLREDIGMTVRLVINCNGMKINTVKEAFEKSLRARLMKTNPDTDFACLNAFRSIFTNDIPIPSGTTVEFRRTSDGKLVTEIEGNQIGAVHSKELCTAFFDMYIGDGPISEQAKEEIGRNVAKIIKNC